MGTPNLRYVDGKKLCARCKEYKDTSNFGRDNRTTDQLRSYCRECSATHSRESAANKFKADAEEWIPLIAIQRFMKKNPIIYKDFIRKYTFQLEPVMREVREEVMEEHRNRSAAANARSRSGGGRFYPGTKLDRVIRSKY